MPKQTAKKTTRRTAQPSGPRKVSRAQLIDLLNKDLAKEFSALVQYVQHAAVITGPEYDAIAGRAHRALERGAPARAHALEPDRLPRRCAVGGRGRRPRLPGLEAMLEQDLAGELDAIARYRERIAQAEMLQEYGLRRALEDILIVEEEHARDLQSALNQ